MYDQHMLDHVLAILMQADASCRVLEENDTNIKEFEKKETFAPAQKMRNSLFSRKRVEIQDERKNIHLLGNNRIATSIKV